MGSLDFTAQKIRPFKCQVGNNAERVRGSCALGAANSMSKKILSFRLSGTSSLSLIQAGRTALDISLGQLESSQ